MESFQRVLTQRPSPRRERDFPPDIIRLLEVLARIEKRRQERLRTTHADEKSGTRL